MFHAFCTSEEITSRFPYSGFVSPSGQLDAVKFVKAIPEYSRDIPCSQATYLLQKLLDYEKADVAVKLEMIKVGLLILGGYTPYRLSFRVALARRADLRSVLNPCPYVCGARHRTAFSANTARYDVEPYASPFRVSAERSPDRADLALPCRLPSHGKTRERYGTVLSRTANSRTSCRRIFPSIGVKPF